MANGEATNARRTGRVAPRPLAAGGARCGSWWRRRPAGVQGFALLETMVASSVLLLLLTFVGLDVYTQQQSLSASQSAEVASAYLNQAIEQVRALPFADIQAGLYSGDPTLATDTNIVKSGTTYTYKPTGATIPVTSTDVADAPLNPHQSSHPVNHVSYEVSTYPTEKQYQSQSTNLAYAVTVVVTWSGGPAKRGGTLTGQTVVYSTATGCVSATSNPYSGPCLPYFSADATAGGGSVTVTPATPGDDAIAGLGFTSFGLELPTANSTLLAQQVGGVAGSVQASYPLQTPATGTAAVPGSDSASSNDPAAGEPVNSSASFTQSANAIEDPTAGGPDWIMSTPGHNDTGTSESTASAATAENCDDLSSIPVAQNTALPCGSGSVGLAGSTATLSAGFSAASLLGGVSLGTATLAALTAQPENDAAIVEENTAPGTSSCLSTSTTGCAHAGAEQALGESQFGGLPSQFPTPTGWLGYVVAIKNFSEQTSVESGSNAAIPSLAVPIANLTTPSLSYWNGSGYTCLSLGAAVAGCTTVGATSNTSFTPTTVSESDAVVNPAAALTVTASAMSTGSVLQSANASGCGTTACTAESVVKAPLDGATINYTITQGSTLIAYFNLAINLGTLTVSTSYQAAA